MIEEVTVFEVYLGSLVFDPLDLPLYLLELAVIAFFGFVARFRICLVRIRSVGWGAELRGSDFQDFDRRRVKWVHGIRDKEKNPPKRTGFPQIKTYE